MSSIEQLRKKQQSLKEQICSDLDILFGTVGKAPSMHYHNLTTKQDGKTVTRNVGDDLVPKVKGMTKRCREVRKLLRELSSVNWELLKLE